MSCRGSNQVKHNAIFKLLRDELLTKARRDWFLLSEEQQKTVMDINVLTCGLHVVPNLARVTGKALNAYHKMENSLLTHKEGPAVEFCNDAAR